MPGSPAPPAAATFASKGRVDTTRVRSTCTLHQVDRTRRSQKCVRSQSALGTQYLYYRWRRPIRWSTMHHVEFVLPNLVVSFFVRDIEPVLRQTVIDRKSYTEYVFRQDNRSMMVRRRPGETDMIVLQHAPDFPLTPPPDRAPSFRPTR